MDESRCAALETMFLALSDKTRLRLLTLMAGGEVSVGYLAEQLSDSQPKISRHLAYLRGAGLVSTRRDGKWIYYNETSGESRRVSIDGGQFEPALPADVRLVRLVLWETPRNWVEYSGEGS